jgi:hypothetical protein
MDELSTPPIPEPVRAEDHRQPRAPVAPRPLEKRLRAQNRETETIEQDEPVDNSEPKHYVDISV